MTSTDARGVHLSERSAANKVIPYVDGHLAEPPKGLNKEAQAAWNMAIANAPEGWLTTLDFSVLEQWARDYAMYRRLQSLIDHEGYIVEDEGGKKAHPLFPTLFKAKAALATEEKELGFTPSARARVRVSKPEVEKNDFGDF